ncbi:MAG: IclR family transcriptional regulator [Deltaproteobacteria bacterium]|nr:IclR family transcriptional regulator [Deltaproteobacteria bacterium]
MKSVNRAFELLACFQLQSQLSVEDLTKRLGWPASSVYRFVQVLRARGVLALDSSTRRYRLGPFLYQLGKTGPDLSELAQPALEKLSRESGETSFLSVRSGWETRYAACVESSERIRFTAPLGRTVPLYAGASAKVILAFMEEEEQRAYLHSVRLGRLCKATVVDKRRLEQSLLLIRRRGYDFTQEELYHGAWGIAAPVLDASGAAIASLAIAGVKFRLPKKRLPRFVSMIREAAREISQRLIKANAGDATKIRRTGS